jgi:HEPN domain-containing protein
MKPSVKEWIERGQHDLEAARLLLDREAHADIVLFHIHQAVEKYLKGFLIQHGWTLKKIHDLETLITEATDFDSVFKQYLDVGRTLTAFYYTERYPPGPLPFYSTDEVDHILETASELIERIMAVLSSLGED